MARLLKAPARIWEFCRLPVWSMMRVQAEIRASTSRPVQSRQAGARRALACEAPASSTADKRKTEVNLHIVAAPAGCQNAESKLIPVSLGSIGNKDVAERSVRWVTLGYGAQGRAE